MTDEEYKIRKSDEITIRLEQKFDDFCNSCTLKCDIANKRLDKLEDFMTKVHGPARAIGWVFIIMLGSFLTAIGIKLVKYIEMHWH